MFMDELYAYFEGSKIGQVPVVPMQSFREMGAEIERVLNGARGRVNKNSFRLFLPLRGCVVPPCSKCS